MYAIPSYHCGPCCWTVWSRKAYDAVSAPPLRAPRKEAAMPEPDTNPVAREAFDGSISRIPLASITDDPRFMFRTALRVGDLRKSIEEFGQQQPVIVRRLEAGGDTFQLISGFRRYTAMSQLEATHIAAVIRDDLLGADNDARTFRAAVLENTARDSYSDIERAHVIRQCKANPALANVDIRALLGLSVRQINNLNSLLELPDIVQEAIDDSGCSFKSTHALQLRKLQRKYEPDGDSFDWPRWIDLVRDDGLSVSQLVAAVNREYRSRPAPTPSVLGKHTDMEARIVHLSPVKLVIDELSEDDKRSLRTELLEIAALLN